MSATATTHEQQPQKPPEGHEPKKRARIVELGDRLVREQPLGTLGATITLLLLLTAILADVLAPYGMNETSRDVLLGPTAEHLLGTDNLGRDLLSRVIYGARISVIVGLAASLLATLVSLLIGMMSGYIGGTLDLIVQRFVDSWMSLPMIVVLMVIISMVGPGMLTIIINLGFWWGIIGSRIIRSAVISSKEKTFVRAAVATGSSTRRVLLKHILPDVMAPTIILFSTRVPNVILAEAMLSFLGFGIPAPVPSWGGMLSGVARNYMFMNPWMVVWPGLALAIVVYGVNMFGDALRDLLDPKLRGGIGRYDTGKMREKVEPE